MGIVFGGVDLETAYGVYALGKLTYGAPERDLELIHVPGRSGDVVVDHGCYQNVQVTYPECWILDDWDNNIKGLRDHLLKTPAYRKLADPYHPDTYRMGVYRGPFEPEAITGNKAGKFDLVFDCQPQRWLTSGDESIIIANEATDGSATATISNPTAFQAVPDIRCSYKADQGATVSLYVNSKVISFTSTGTGWRTLSYTADTGIASIYGDSVSVTRPVLKPGTNTITISGVTDISSFYVIPHWYIL